MNQAAPLPLASAPSLRGRLLALVLLLVLPALAASWFAVYMGYRNDREELQKHLNETARALSLVVDRQLGQAEAVLWALATSPHLASQDYAAFDAQARRVIRDPDTWVVLAERGRQLVNTLLPLGAKLPEPQDQDYARELSTERASVSNLFVGLAAQQPAVRVSLLIAREGREPYILNIITRYQGFSRILSDQNLPASWVGAILDRTGTVAARNHDAPRFVGKPGTPDMVRRVREGVERGVFESVSLDGIATVVAFSRSHSSGWTFLVAVPQTELSYAARQSALLLLLIGGLLVALGTALAFAVARSIARPVEALASDALALGRGEPPSTTIGQGFKEAQVVRMALAEAATVLTQRATERDRAEADLRNLNQTLEQRVAERTRELADANSRLLAEMEERRQAEARLSRAERLEAVGQLTSGLAHDFNNLLTAVLGSLEMLSRRLGSSMDERARRLIENATGAAERGAQLTAQLLAFSRQQRLTPQAIDVGTSVDGIVRLIRSTLGGTIRVQSALRPDLWPAMADPTQLELIILNLALNARDAMPLGGALTVEASNVVMAEPMAPEDPPAGEFVMVAVSDTGTGMAPDVLARVFEPFFTTKEVGKGTGLGLPQVLGIAKQLGGGVRIASRPGEGTSVQVYLPRAQASIQPSKGSDEAAATGEDALRGCRILLVDDDADVRKAVAGMLAEAGCVVREAPSGLAAIEDVEREIGCFDLVLTDYAMPGMSGVDAARRIKVLAPDLPLVLMTGYAERSGLPEEGLVEAVLQKPFRSGELRRTVARVVNPKLSRRNVIPFSGGTT